MFIFTIEGGEKIRLGMPADGEVVLTRDQAFGLADLIRTFAEDMGLAVAELVNYKLPEEVYQEILHHLRRGSRVGAIRVHRNATDAGLTESKEFVEDLADKEGIDWRAKQ